MHKAAFFRPTYGQFDDAVKHPFAECLAHVTPAETAVLAMPKNELAHRIVAFEREIDTAHGLRRKMNEDGGVVGTLANLQSEQRVAQA